MLDRSVAPPSYPLKKFKFPKSERTALGNDVPLLLVPSKQQPIIFFELILKSGKYFETKEDLAFLTSKMILGGTNKKSAEELSFDFEFLGSFIDISSSLDHISIKIYCLKKNFGQTLTLFDNIVSDPLFPENELNTQKSIRKQQIQSKKSNSSQFATLSFNELLFGKTHPYGKIITPENTDERSLGEISDYFSNQLFNSPKIILAGDYDDDEIRLIELFISKLQISYHSTQNLLESKTIGKKEILKPGCVQASLRHGDFFIPKNHKDIHTASIANTLLGGFFGSRLMKNIREEKGLTYGIHSSIIHTLHSSYWMIGSEMQNEKAEKGLEEILNEINILAENPPESKEVEILCNFLRGKLLTSMDSIFGIASTLKSLLIHDLNNSYLDDYLEKLDHIHPKDISEMTAKYFASKTPVTLFVR